MANKNNFLKQALIWVALGIVIGVIGYKLLSNYDREQAQREREELVKKLEEQSQRIENLKQGLASEREIFHEEIGKSEVRYDSLEREYRIREARLWRELNRIKRLTVKELEYEADSIYHANIHLRDSLESD